MKRKPLLFLLLMAMFAPLAMQAQGLMKAPGVTLQADPAQELAMQQAAQPREDGWLQYDDGTITGLYSLGLTSATYGAMYPSSLLGDNNTLTKVKFVESQYMTGNVTIYIYSGGTEAPGDLLYTEAVATSGVTDWREVELAQAVTFEPNENLWIIISVVGNSTSPYIFPVCNTNEPNNQWFYYSGNWYNLGDLVSGLANMGWMIRGYVEYVGAGITCFRPTVLSVDHINKTTADVSWNSDASAWQICLNGDEANAIDVTQNPYTLTGLDPETDYTVKVRANCGSDGYSEWTGNVSFTTLEACPDITELTASYISPNSATIDWTGNNDSYDLRYGVISNAKEPITNNDWYYYDDGEMTSSIGLGGEPFSWGVMFPAGTYIGDVLYNVSVFDGDYDMEGTLTVYNDGATAPANEIASMGVTLTGANEFVEFDLSQLSIDPTKNLWVVFSFVSGGTYPATVSNDVTNDPNGRWTYDEEDGWFDLSIALPNYSWMVRAQIGYDTSSVSWTPVTGINNPYELTGLTPGTTYAVQVRANCGDGTYTDWATTYFTTLSLCSTPTDLDITDLTATSATLNWTGYQNRYNVQYRPVAHGDILIDEGFENGLGDWTTIDADGDGYDWMLASSTMGSGNGHNDSNECVFSQSYDNTEGVLYPDNFLVSPQVELGGLVTFWACAQDANYAAEHFGVAVSTRSNDSADDFVTIQEWTMTAKGVGAKTSVTRSGNRAQGVWYPFTVDLSEFSGYGYVAIRHFNCNDQFYLDVDDIIIEGPSTPEAWIPMTANENSLVLTGLAAETEYEWQVQGVCASGNTDWSEMSTFITPPSCPVPTGLAVERVTSNSAVAYWTSTAGSFDIKLNEEVIEEGITENYFILDLDPGTIYTIEVRANCGNDDYSHWTEPVAFLTECSGVKDLPYTYDFENIGEYYACWYAESYNDENEYGVYWEDEEHTNRVFVFSSWYEADDYTQVLISPELNATTPVSVQFDYKVSSPYAYESFLVGYVTEEMEYYEWPYEVYETNNEEWMTFSGLFPEGTKYVAIYYFSEYQYYLFLDNFRFDVPKTFVTDGDWDEANNWLPVGVPTSLDNVSIEAEATIPADCVAEVNAVLIGEGGSITIEDGGQLYHSTDELEVTVKKNIPAYTGDKDYKLFSIPFYGNTVPQNMTTPEGYDLYRFDNSQQGEEWQNNKVVEFEDLYMDEGYLYANPEGVEISMTGNTKPSNVYNGGYINYEYIYLYYDDTENEVNGWYLLGNPFLVDAYIYNVIFDEDGENIEDIIPMNAMYYDENGEMQTIEGGGPIAPMQGFFVSITEEVEAYVFPFDFLNAKNMPSLKNLKKRNGNNNTVPAVKLPIINADKSTRPMIVNPMSVKTNAVKQMPNKK